MAKRDKDDGHGGGCDNAGCTHDHSHGQDLHHHHGHGDEDENEDEDGDGADWHDCATAHDDRSPPQGLTRNEALVFDALSGGYEPLKAYEILDHLKDKGVRAPMTVYRALEGLEEKGYIHKLERTNSFVRCDHGAPHEVQIFLICEQCGSAREIQIESVRLALAPAIRELGFAMATARLEARGRCAACAQH